MGGWDVGWGGEGWWGWWDEGKIWMATIDHGEGKMDRIIKIRFVEILHFAWKPTFLESGHICIWVYTKNGYLLTVYVAMYGNDAMIMGFFIGYQLVFLISIGLGCVDYVILPSLL